jgi:hypothetical protein
MYTALGIPALWVVIAATILAGIAGGYSALSGIAFLAVLGVGAAYWRYKARLLSGRVQAAGQAVWLLVYAIGGAAVLTFPLAVLVALLGDTLRRSGNDPLLAGVLYLLTLVAFVHLFVVKLVRSATDARARRTRRQVNARLMRELIRTETRR